MKKQSYLSTENLAAGYDGKAWIREISIHASRGEIVTLIGPNGAGKSTILKSIAGQLKPVGGVISLDGRPREQWPETEIARRMAVMMTERTQPELMTCFDVAAMGRYPHTGRFGTLSEADRKVVWHALDMVHAKELADRDFSRMDKDSGFYWHGPSASSRRSFFWMSRPHFWTSAIRWSY